LSGGQFSGWLAYKRCRDPAISQDIADRDAVGVRRPASDRLVDSFSVEAVRASMRAIFTPEQDRSRPLARNFLTRLRRVRRTGRTS